MCEDRAGDFRLDDLAAFARRVRGVEDIVHDVISVDAIVWTKTGCRFLVARGEHGRFGLWFRDHDGLRENGKTGSSGGGFVELSPGNLPFPVGRSLVVRRDGIACRVVDISSCRVGDDCRVDTPGNLRVAGTSASVGKS